MSQGACGLPRAETPLVFSPIMLMPCVWASSYHMGRFSLHIPFEITYLSKSISHTKTAVQQYNWRGVCEGGALSSGPALSSCALTCCAAPQILTPKLLIPYPLPCRGSVVAIDSAVPRREEGARTDDDLSASSMVSLSRGLPSVPSIPSLHSPPSHHPQQAAQQQHPGAQHHPGGPHHPSSAYLDAPAVTLEVCGALNPYTRNPRNPGKA